MVLNLQLMTKTDLSGLKIKVHIGVSQEMQFKDKLQMNWELKNECHYAKKMEYYSVVKNNDILKIASKWMELGKAILIEVTQT